MVTPTTSREISTFIGRNEKNTNVPWITLTETNALSSVGQATALLDAGKIGYLRTTQEGNIEWQKVLQVRTSSVPSSRVQFHSSPDVATHWISVEVPLKRQDDQYFVTIHEGERFYMHGSPKFLVIERTNYYSDINGPARGEEPQTKFEFFFPFGEKF